MKKKSIGILSGLAGVGIGILGGKYIYSMDKKTSKEEKFRTYYTVLNQWMKLKNENKSLEEYFVKNNIKTIGIYGMGELGERFYEELKDKNVDIKYGIDKMGGYIDEKIEIISMDNDLELVDAIIVTPMFDFDSIFDELSNKTESKIISLEDVVFGI